MFNEGGCHHGVDVIVVDDVPMLGNCVDTISPASSNASILVRYHCLTPHLNCSNEGFDVHVRLRFCSGLVREGFDVHVRLRFRAVLVREGFVAHVRLRLCSGLVREGFVAWRPSASSIESSFESPKQEIQRGEMVANANHSEHR